MRKLLPEIPNKITNYKLVKLLLEIPNIQKIEIYYLKSLIKVKVLISNFFVFFSEFDRKKCVSNNHRILRFIILRLLEHFAWTEALSGQTHS